jgi:GNAT superfamily N-acetyltransferase
MEPRLRVADGADVAPIVRCWLRSWRAAYENDLPAEQLDAEAEKRRSFDWSQGIDSQESTVLVAVDGDAVIGVMQADLALAAPRDLPEVTMLNVDPSAWGSGVAPRLLWGGLHWISQQGRHAARVRVVEAHRRARRFHEREGFVLDRGLDPTQNDFFRLIYYRLRLPG